MPSKRLINSSRLAASACMLVLVTVGCSQYAINMFADERVPREDMMTQSEREARAATAAPSPVRRIEGSPQEVVGESGEVVHWPLWFEDPFEDKGSDDGKFAWTWEDYFAIPYSAGRILVNLVGLPASMVVTPPGTPMVSDGVLSNQILGRNHDARPVGKGPASRPVSPAFAKSGTSTEETFPYVMRSRVEVEEVGPVGENASWDLLQQEEESLPTR